MLKHVDIGWKWLAEHLNAIIDEVNQNKPLASSSIAIDVGPSGSLIRETSVSDSGTSQPSQPGQPSQLGQPSSAGQWVTITTVDPYTCRMSAIQVWARPVQ